MESIKTIALAGTMIFGSVGLSSTASATAVIDGTVSAVALFNPKVTIGKTTSTYSATSGSTFEISGTGGFASVGGKMGTLTGIVKFSDVVGTTLNEILTNLFTFNDGKNGTYTYSALTVTTNSFVDSGKVASSGTLYLVGTISDANLGYTSTPASLSVQFNSTGGSDYSSALTLAVPPSGVGAVPETASWVMMILGMGAVGYALRRHQKVSTNVTYG